ncbi:hypothetical protein GX48_02959 [Paracoccidioides brasiliensis]|nr:hypothetical protein GX48_02959 [Paracoccidioides brasiliensis]
MSYLPHPFPFGGPPAIPVEQTVGLEVLIGHPHLGHYVNSFILPHDPFDIVDYCPSKPASIEEYEYTENLSRPRLTKEQVDTLEAQFQTHPKPNSNVKRQLATQTNLSLPRVANWFQNRRAKAKQQKRQEEFERTQASENGEQWESNETSRQEGGLEAQPERPELISTPTQDQLPISSSASPPSQPHTSTTQSECSVSVEKAVNENMSANAQFYKSEHNAGANKALESNMMHHSSQPRLKNEAVGTATSGIPEWNGHEDDCNSVFLASPQSGGNSFDFTHVIRQQLTPNDNPFEIRIHESPQFPAFHFNHEPDGWGCHGVPNLMGRQHDAQDLGDDFQPLPFHGLQSPLFPGEQRRGSYSSEHSDLTDIPFHPEINNDLEASPENISQLSLAQLHHHQVEPCANWRYPEKEVDLAARRKRPRLAAIGTSAISRLYVPSSMSPTAMIQGMGAGHILRHAKSTQNLSPSRNSRYPGIRNTAAARRSPLGITSFAEANRFNPTNATDMMSAVPGLVTTALAPPTPLTPEDFQTLLPPTPSDNQYCVSPTDEMGCTRFFPISQPMQVHLESPPATPLNLSVLSQVQYQQMGISMPAAASQRTTFQEYTLSVPTNPMSTSLWHGPSSMSSPETFQMQQPTIHMPQPTHISPIAYGNSLDSGNPSFVEGMASQSASPQCTIKSCSTPPSCPEGSTSGPHKVTEFLIQEFPQQQEAHRRAAQQLPPQRPMNYTFSNHTPNDFYA